MRISIKFGFIFLFFAILAGCARPVPPHRAITDGIFSTQPPNSLSNYVVGGEDKVVVVMLSENTKENVQYLRERQKDSAERPFTIQAIVDSHVEIMDPNYSLSWIAKKIKNNFGSVQLMSDPDKLSQYRYDYLIIVDAIFTTTDWGVNDATASFTTQFYDSNNKYLADAKSSRKVQVRSAGGGGPHGVELFRANHAVRVAALEEWERAFNQVVQHEHAAPPRGGTGTDTCVQAALAVQSVSLRKQAIASCTP